MTMQAHKQRKKKQSFAHEEDQSLMRAIKQDGVGKWIDILRDNDFAALKRQECRCFEETCIF